MPRISLKFSPNKRRPAACLTAENVAERLALALVSPLVDDEAAAAFISGSQMLPSKCAMPTTFNPSSFTSP